MEQMKTVMDAGITAGTSKKYSLPLTHFEYGFIDKCEDVKLLEKIFRVLKSGDEGCFPHLETFCEQKIAKLNPKSRVLRKDNPLWTKGDLERDERQQLDEDLKTWTDDMQNMEVSFKASTTVETFDPESTELPPIRSGTITMTKDGAKTTKSTNDNQKKRAMPRNYREWDKVDIDKELEKVDEDDKKAKEKTIIGNREVKNIPEHIDATGLTENERLMKANREKDKGNEAFRSNDFKEAIIYYSRSISLMPTAASYNNRALGYLKHEDWQNALKDTNIVLKMEPENVKALLRRGTSYKGLKKFDQARQDLNKVLAFEPKNKRAQELLEEVSQSETKEKERRRTKGTRMKIEDVEEEDTDDKADEQEIPVVNGVNTSNDEKATNKGKDSDDEPVIRKAPRRMQIVETDSDDEEDDDKEELGEDADEEDEEIESEVEENGVVNGDVSKQEKKTAPVGAGKVAAADVAELNKDDKTETQIKLEKQVKVDSQENSEKVSEVPTQAVNTDKQEKDSEETVDVKSEVNESSEDVNVSDDEPEVSSDGVKTETEAVELKRPVFYMRDLPTSCVRVKEQATQCFKSGQYGEACLSYTKVIQMLEKEKDQDVNLSLMYSNRAACQLKIGDLPGTIKDSTQSLQLVPHSVKPLLRRAIAYEHSERYRQAYIDYRHVLLLDLRMDQAHLGTKRCQHHMHEKDGPRWREKFQMPKVSQWEIPEIIGLDGKPIAQVSYVTNTPPSQSQATSCSNSQSESGTGTTPVVKDVPVETSSKASCSVQKEDRKPEPPVKEEPVKQEPIKLSPQQKFDARKSEGNEHVKKGKFREAVRCYSDCVDVQPQQAVSYTNRALCYLRLNQAEEALTDCNKALEIEKDNIKALFRRAQARKMLKEYKEGVQDLNTLLKLDPKNTAAQKEMDLMKKYWGEQLNAMKKDIGKMQKEKQGLQDHIKDKQRRPVKIQEVDSDESDDNSNGASKSANKTATKHNKSEAASTKKTSNQSATETKQSSKPTTSATKQTKEPAKKPNLKPVPQDSKTSTAASKKSQIRQTSTGLPQVPKTVPKLEKATPYEFLAAWNAMKKSDTVKPYYDLLKQIKPSDLPTVISNKLDGPMLNTITKCISEFYIKNGELDNSFEILKNLSTVPRFGTITMFMTGQEKIEMKLILQQLQQHKSSVFSSADVNTLRQSYML